MDEDGLKVRCNIAYEADAENNFFGGTVTSGDMVLKTAHITDVTASNVGPIDGDTITLTCVAIGEKKPDFRFSSSGRKSVDKTFFEEVKALEVTEDGTTYTAKYVVKTIAPTVLISGQVITCMADYGKALGKSTQDITVTTYHDCTKKKIRSLNPADNGAIITEKKDGDGSITQTITCPDDTASARFSLITSSNSAASVTCTKTSG